MTKPELAPESKTLWRRILVAGRRVLGICCILVGIIGLGLPVIQGIALIALGFVLLGKKEWFFVVLNFFRTLGRKLGFGRGRADRKRRDSEAV
jgi:hypothetical protein